MMNLLTWLTSAAKSLCDIKPHNRISYFFMLTLLSGAYSASSYAQQTATAIPVPQYTTLDAFGVNVSGNTVAPTINTVSIGGETGLSHSITLQGNIFNIASDEHGVRDKFAGGIRSTDLGQKKLNSSVYASQNLWVLTATAMGDSAEFVELCNGTFTGDLTTSCSPTYFEAVHDKRHTLTLKYDQGPRAGEQGMHVVWTKPDGTEVYYTSAYLSKATSGGFYKIVYPNGFTINVLSDITVKTNTGFQLKYNYVYDYRPVDPSKSGIIYNGGYPISQTWWQVNPKSITAVNNAYDYCDVNQQGPCTNYTKTWPTVTFDWPGGMPRTFFMGKSVFRVTNPTGAIAEFNYEAKDAAVGSEATNSNMAPLLMSIKPFGASQPTVSYTYTKPIHVQSVPGYGSYGYSIPGEPWILSGATGIAGSSDYSVYDLANYHGKGYRGYRLVVEQNTDYPTIQERIVADGGDRTINFYINSMANLVEKDNYASASSKQYTYINNNVQTLTDQATGVQEAGGYATCTDSNRKTCNKPTWIKNNGVVTSLTYHDPSGQIATVTSPADKNGLSKVVRYGYELKYANYIQTNGGSKTQSPTGIWLKTTEKTCNNTATVGDACAGNSNISAANDEVVITYEYNNDNLLLTGKTVKAVNSNNVLETRRTCYQYDIYGNRIGETQPNAQLASCPQ